MIMMAMVPTKLVCSHLCESFNRSGGLKKTLPQIGGFAQATIYHDMKIGSHLKSNRDDSLNRPAPTGLAYGNSRFCIRGKNTKPAHEHHLQAGPHFAGLSADLSCEVDNFNRHNTQQAGIGNNACHNFCIPGYRFFIRNYYLRSRPASAAVDARCRGKNCAMPHKCGTAFNAHTRWPLGSMRLLPIFSMKSIN